jgi:Tol biopolymer transport system component
MSDADQTILSNRGSEFAPNKSGRNPLLVIGGIGCILLLCAGVLIGGGLFLLGDQINDAVANLTGGDEPQAIVGPTAEPSPTSTATLAPTLAPEPTLESNATVESEATLAATDAETSTAITADPFMSEVTFALAATEDQVPIDPGDSFEEGITEVHAIFEYSGILADNLWERVWYLDGEEILRSEEVWGGDAAGIFDYFINAGGEPLTPGEWTLELYVEGELLTSGTFTIEGADVVAIMPEPSDTPSPTATSAESAGAETSTPLSTATATSTPRPPSRTYKLVYTKWDGGRHNLYIGDTDGSTEQFILHRGAGPSWSKDGGSVFFYGEPGVNVQDRTDFPGVGSCELPSISDGIMAVAVSEPPNDICVVETTVVQGPGWNEGTARWTSVSPDGGMVAYDAKPGGGDYRIFFLGTEDNQQYQFEIIGEQGDWSPDSQKIVYRSGRDGTTGIWISNRNDSGHTLITNTGSDSFPAWSPNGATIAFSRDEGGNVDIYTVDVDGSNLQRLTEAPGPDTLPTFTPDGSIVFRSARSGSWGIWKMNSDGSNQQEIVASAGVGPDWSYSKMDVLP